MRKGIGKRCTLLLRRMESSVTKDPFPKAAQDTLLEVAKCHQYRSPYWFTLAQCKRSLGATLLPNAQPTLITLAVQAVIPFDVLPKDMQDTIVDQHPAYFASGVGILSHRFKWNAVLAKRLVQQLNPHNRDRAFYVDVAFATETLRITPDPKDIVDITAQSSVLVYNGDQLTDPFKAAPCHGIALNALTGRRLGQPGHDILLAVGILRGYVSPYWVTASQISKLNATLSSAGKESGVYVPTLVGTVVPLADIKDEGLRKTMRKQLYAAFHLWGRSLESDLPPRLVAFITSWGLSTGPTAGKRIRDDDHISNTTGGDVPSSPYSSEETALLMKALDTLVCKSFMTHPLWLLYGANGWEALRSEAIIRAMFTVTFQENVTSKSLANPIAGFTASLKTASGTERSIEVIDKFTFVNLEDTAARCTEYASAVEETLAQLRRSATGVGEATHPNNRSFLLQNVTKRQYFNAAAFEAPHYIAPTTRPIAIVNGKLAGQRTESFLRHHALKNKFSSPVWLTRRGAKMLGVSILPSAVGFLPPSSSSRGAGHVEFYNIDDVEDKQALMRLYPIAAKHLKPGTTRHMMLENGAWKPMYGAKRTRILSAHGRAISLWLSVSEVILSGVKLSRDAVAYPAVASNAKRKPSSKADALSVEEDDIDSGDASRDEVDADGEPIESRHLLYNSEETSDPVRVIGLTCFYARPQVLRGP
jgi:hypothetical protein